jgi:hypothetical protein
MLIDCGDKGRDTGDGLVVGVFQEGRGEWLGSDAAGFLAKRGQVGRRGSDDPQPNHGTGDGRPP